MLEALIELQEADNGILANLAQRNELTNRLDQLRSLLTRGEAELADKKQKLESVEGFYTQKTGELKTDVARAAQSKSKLTGITRQKEYLASQKELEYLKRANAQKEEEILKLMGAIEEYRTGIATDEERISGLRTEVAREEKDNAKTVKSLEKSIGASNEQRLTITQKIGASVLSRYERILKGREGIAVSPVERATETCLGCNMRLPPQTFIQLLHSKTLMNCPSCQRFIYVQTSPNPEEVNTAEEPETTPESEAASA